MASPPRIRYLAHGRYPPARTPPVLRRPFAILALVTLFAAACTVEPPTDFDGHTRLRFANASDFHAFTDTGKKPAACKFTLTRPWQAQGGETHFLDPNFYKLHDEWYWFRLLNGTAIDGVDTAPVNGPRFATIAAVYAEMQARRTKLPLDLDWCCDGRLYANKFYALSMCAEPACGRKLLGGTLIHYPANPDRPLPQPLWLFELEHGDFPTEAELLRFRSRLQASLPPEMAHDLRWLATTAPYQEDLARSLRQGTGALRDRIVLHAELIVAGEKAGYTHGITAGRVRVIGAGALAKATLQPTDIVVFSEVPDALPPVAGIVTSVPQTPQAHLNLLAAARGTPNAFAAFAAADPVLLKWSQEERKAILEVTETTVRWRLLSEGPGSEWEAWKAKTAPLPVTLTPIDVATAPWTVDLTAGGLPAMRQSLALVGGKSAGMMALFALPGIDGPFLPLSLTVKGYAGHVAPLLPTLAGLLADKAFTDDSRVRFLMLEGPKRYAEFNGQDPAAMKLLAGYSQTPPTGAMGVVWQAGGVQALVRNHPLSKDFADVVVATLKTRYAALSPKQGLRFRSSSTAEDVDGFNGAGVYASNTGFLFPEQQKSAQDKARTVEAAVKETWASYWAYGAFEERALAKAPHLDGRMGVLVHPRFDDEVEAANGVALLAFKRDPQGDRIELVVDVQQGAESVTNPRPDKVILPEVVKVTRIGDGPPQVQRVQGSTEVAPGVKLLSDAELLKMFADVAPLAPAWLDDANLPLHPAERARSVVLDFEFRKVKAGWPALGQAPQLPARLVWKQVRPLSRAMRVSAAHLDGVRLPRDVQRGLRRAQSWVCGSAQLDLKAYDVWTDPGGMFIAGVPMVEFAKVPFAARVEVKVNQPLPALGLDKGPLRLLEHIDAALTHPLLIASTPGPTAKAWDLLAKPLPAQVAAMGWDTLRLDAVGPVQDDLVEVKWSLHKGTATASGTMLCNVKVKIETPQAWLQTLLP